MSLLNVWTDKDLSVVAFIDWQPPLVVDISEEALKGKNTNGHARKDDADETDSDDSDDSDDEDEPEPISKAEALRHMKRNVEKDLTVEYLKELLAEEKKYCSENEESDGSNANCRVHREL